tara:strand:- start:5769 stop:6428 length:660 start_codon:yes stop_codon:yes gene_type:complete
MTNLYQQLTIPPPPDLPSPGRVYDTRLVSQNNRSLLTYFTKITNLFASVFGPRGGQYINAPYGAFDDTTDQTATANTATAMTFNTTDFSNGVKVVTSGGLASRITVSQGGIYNFQWSGQFQNTDTQEHDISVWIRINGTDVPGSTGLISVINSHGGIPGHTLVGWNYFLQLGKDEYVELYWSTPNVAVSIQSYVADTSPTRPSTASLIATVSFVSNLSA